MDKQLPSETPARQVTAAAFRGPLPPHAQIFNFLPEADHNSLIDWAIAQEAQFKPAKIFYGEDARQSRIKSEVRQALKLRGAGPFEHSLSAALLAALPRIMAATGYRGEEPRSIEFEINAYGEGDHFAPHIDIPLGSGRRAVGKEKGEDRLISAVYYFHREPKGFSGGRLRLYRFGADAGDPGLPDEDSIRFEPVRNSLVVFPSWAKHGVERVSCPGGRFGDYRFAINCWFCRRLAS